jgi:hypothetical protein
MSAYDSWVERARCTPIERVIELRGIKLKGIGAERIGPCPRCGGTDRFGVNVRKAQWNWREITWLLYAWLPALYGGFNESGP